MVTRWYMVCSIITRHAWSWALLHAIPNGARNQALQLQVPKVA